MDFKYFLCVIGLVLVLEGLPYFAFPNRLKDWLRRMESIPDVALRVFGLAAMIIGLLLIHWGRK